MNRSRKYLAFALASVLGLPLLARAEEEAPVGKLSLTATVDVVSEYIYRGYAYQDVGMIVQPGVTITLDKVVGGDGFSISPYAGMWESLHGRKYEKDYGTGGIRESSFFEHDFIGGAKFGLFGPAAKPAVTLDIKYTAYTSPAGAFNTIHEIGTVLSFNDGNWDIYEASEFGGLNPYVGWYWEVSDTTPNSGLADMSNNGQYLEVGLAPSWTFDVGGADEAGAKVTLSLPIAVGIGLNDYYYDAQGKDTKLGYGKVGPAVEIPFVTSDRWGNWSFTGSVTWYSLWADSTNGGGTGDPGDNAYVAQIGVKVSL